MAVLPDRGLALQVDALRTAAVGNTLSPSAFGAGFGRVES